MKVIIKVLFFVILFTLFICTSVFADVDEDGNEIIIFQDEILEEVLAINSSIDVNGDGKISVEEAKIPSSLYLYERGISNISGLEYFVNLENLHLADNQLTDVTLSNLTKLTVLNLNNNQLTNVTLSSLPKLDLLAVQNNQLTNIILSDFSELRYVSLIHNQLTDITLNNLPMLSQLYLYNNQLTVVTLSNLPKLSGLDLKNNQLTNITLSDLATFKSLDICNNQLTDITLNNLPELFNLSLKDNQLTDVTLSDLAKLRFLYIDNNQLTDITLENLPMLSTLFLSNNQLTDLSKLSNISSSLNFLSLYSNPLYNDQTPGAVLRPDLKLEPLYYTAYDTYVKVTDIDDYSIISAGTPLTFGFEDHINLNNESDRITCHLVSSEGTKLINTGDPLEEPGLYQLIFEYIDGEFVSTSAPINIVVYSPESGSITGGGWVNSPIGSYTFDTTLSGKASFGFVSTYKKNASVPTGRTEFQFKTGSLNFHSDTYDWLIIAGTKAKFKGTGQLNGIDGYGFMITASDGKSKDEVDRFRVKIWDKETDEVIYDNQIGTFDNFDVEGEGTLLGGGSIVIHK